MRALLFAVTAALMAQSTQAQAIIAKLNERSPVPVVTPADNGKTMALKTDGCIIVRFASQAGSTGYDWYMAHDSTGLMKLEARTVTSAAVPMPGAPAQLDFLLCAVDVGQGVVKFSLYRPWEKNTPPAQTMAITVKIAD